MAQGILMDATIAFVVMVRDAKVVVSKLEEKISTPGQSMGTKDKKGKWLVWTIFQTATSA